VGLVGFGMAGRVFHAPLITANPHLHLSHIVQRSGNEAQELHPQSTILRDLAGLLSAPEVELVVIATPNNSHFELASKALEAGKHVVVDKPFTITSSEADRLIVKARECDRLLTVFQNRRWDGDFLTVKDILGKGYLGDLVEFESRFDRFRPALRLYA